MIHIFLLMGVLLLVCFLSSKLLYKYGVPTLLMFLASSILGWDNRCIINSFCDFCVYQ